MTRRRWDYFVRYLAGAIPPNEYQMKPFAAATAALSSGPLAEESAEDQDPQP
jgi:dipeptidyl-peptidase-4